MSEESSVPLRTPLSRVLLRASWKIGQEVAHVTANLYYFVLLAALKPSFTYMYLHKCTSIAHK